MQPARCLEHIGYLGPGIGENARGAPEVNRVAANGAREDGFCTAGRLHLFATANGASIG